MKEKYSKFSIETASEEDRKEIYKLRYLVYAKELQQHLENDHEILTDSLDKNNTYLVIKVKNEICGFISITANHSNIFSLDKYFERKNIPVPFDETLFEIRLLTVTKKFRNSITALLLMYAAKRFVESHGGKHVIAICRKEIMKFYEKAGLQTLHQDITSGKVVYELAIATIDHLNQLIIGDYKKYQNINDKIDWKLSFSFFPPSSCYHGGAFFKAIGEEFDHLDEKGEIINADVLDAWFSPSPKVIKAIKKDLQWILKTSPPIHAEGLINAIAKNRGVKKSSILTGAGSSDLIFLALPHFLSSSSSILILNPCYGEYSFVLENIIHCNFETFNLEKTENYEINSKKLMHEIKKGYDMIILVNPNNPTGVHFPKEKFIEILQQVPTKTLVWIDETYIEYIGKTESLEKFASVSENIIVCKSMSKVYALSGARIAYLCCSPHLIESLKLKTPPWAVSLPAQIAAISALEDEEYYVKKYKESHKLRRWLKQKLMQLGILDIHEGKTNSILFFLPQETFTSEQFLDECKTYKLYLREFKNIKNELGMTAIRVAIKNKQVNKKIIEIIENILSKSK
jgi:histidinol-phosphate/aromatic aminotransferase/cobyric acid decarboxylase-like protein/N-acyl-L-homoserine lactone synthetase